MSSESTKPAAPASIDAIDRRILALLQADAAISLDELAVTVGLSRTPCWRRIQRLERDGVIRARVAVLDPCSVGLGLTALVSVQAPGHAPDWLRSFAKVVLDMPEIVEAHRLAGDVDYQLQVVVADTAAYDRFYARLIDAIEVKTVSTRFVLQSLKSRGPLPL
jgi:Lrp/AsnC family transcriptional regulator